MPLKFKELTGLWMLVVFFVLVSLGVSAANNQNIDYSFTHAPPGNCFKATPNHGGILQWLVDVQNNGPGRMHIVSAAFHDPHSGCGATTYSPSGGWHVGGTTGYYEGGSGHTSFTYDLNSKNCGRVQVDAGFRDDNDEDIVFIGYVIDYGVNCNSNSNHEPVVTSCTTPSSIALGSAAKISYSISDPDGDSFTVAINWGDGTTTSGGSSSATHVYSSPGTYTVSGTVTDSKGASFSGTCGTITVTHGTVNHPPTISSCSPSSSTVSPGGTVGINYAISDSEGDSFSVTVNWGDGTINSGGQSSATHTYNSPGTYTVSITATDSKGESSTRSCGTITVSSLPVNHPPTISTCSPSSSPVVVGSVAAINYVISDPESNSFTVMVNWGDGTTSSGSSSAATHTYTSTGTFTVTITATDSLGDSSSRSCSSIVVVPMSGNHPPEISSCTSPSTSIVGTTATIHYSVSDPDADTFSVTINWGDGSSSSGGPFSAAHIYLAAGTYFVTVTATDSRGASSSRNCGQIIVIPTGGNNPPVISSCNAPSTVTVGTAATINYAISDPEGDSFTVSINWGDGTSSSGGASSASHTYSSTGTFTVTITATDSRGASSSRNCGQIIVIPTGGNHPPIISSCTPPSTVTIGTTATINYIISDPDGDPFTVLVNWGDGTTTSGGQSSSTHTYTSTGTFSVTITVTDSRGASTGSFCGSIMVTDGESNPSSGSKLKIIDVDVKVDGRTSSGLSDGEKISRTAGPESKIDFKIKTRNLFSTTGGLTIRNIVVKTTIESIDNGDDLEDESSDFDLRPQSEKTVTLNNFKLPLNVDDSDYNVHIEAEGEDENGTTQRDELNIVLEVKKDKHDLRFTKLVVNKAKINCNEGFMLNYQIINLGREDEEKSYVEIKSDELGIDSFQRDIEIQSGTDGNTYSKIVPLKILNNVEDGSYPLTVNIYSDDGTLQDTKTVQLNVQDCGVKKQINQTTTNTLSSVNSNLFGTETVEKTIQIPFIQLFFRGAGGGLFWILISTLILSIFFVLAAIILMAGRDEEDY
ncbi:MAG TPA: PKD domain-containing protein [Candidatus Nanoarchaeia archaeon]|nr:PKD domain-containing protein [Candidatus Nanoarchaeia archaeon]